MEQINYRSILEQLQAADPTFERLGVVPVFYSFVVCIIMFQTCLVIQDLFPRDIQNIL